MDNIQMIKNEYFPWNIPFAYRIKILYENSRMGFKSVVFLYETADSSTFRYRVYNMCQSLEESLYWKGNFFFENELEKLSRYLDYIDLLVLVRFHWSKELGEFVAKYKSMRGGKKVIFDIDDLVFDIRYLPELLQSIGSRKVAEETAYWKGYVSSLNHTAYLCDIAITTNGYLKNLLEDSMQKKCYVIPNTFNRWQEQISQKCCKEKKTSKNEFTLGYFSGSPTHEKDFLMIAEELYELLCGFPDMKLKIVGYMNLPDYMERLRKNGKIMFVGFQNFINLQKEIADVNINLVPLVNTVFTNCKSELKYFEASIVETISIMSPTYVYKTIIKDGDNGFLCEFDNSGRWYQRILDIYYERVDIRKISRAARHVCEEKYRYSAVRNDIEKLCFQMIER